MIQCREHWIPPEEFAVVLCTQAIALPFWGLLLLVRLASENVKNPWLNSLFPHTFLCQVQRITHLDRDKYDKNKYY